jgi:serine/threonine protein kinase
LNVLFSLAIYAVEGLANIHALNIVHGDIHGGNIMLEYAEGTTVDVHRDPVTGKIQGLKFIDFGRSFKPESDVPTSPVYRRFIHYHQMFTHWQIEGYTWSKRDDMYKLIHMIAMLMHDENDYVDFENSLMIKIDKETGKPIEGSVDRLISWKRDHFIFRIPGSDPFTSLPAKNAIVQNLSQVLNLVRAVEINGDIPYERIIQLFTKLL